MLLSSTGRRAYRRRGGPRVTYAGRVEQLPISSRYRSRAGEPVDDAERNEVSERLNAAYAAGDLAEEEYRGRLEALFGARTLGELAPVVQGLPPVPTHDQPAIVAQGGRPGELSESRRPGALVPLVLAGGTALVLLLVVLLAALLLLG